MNVVSIGTVKSRVPEEQDGDWGKIVSEIHLDPELASGLAGLEAFSHLLVLFWMDRSTFSKTDDLVRRPRGRADMPLVGIFAQRAKHRPNPIGVTAVRLLERTGNALRVQGLDALDGTPVLDLKPYFSAFDAVGDPTAPPWVDALMKGYF